MKDALLAIDIGTSGCRTTVFDRSGHVLGTRSVEYAASMPRPGWSEQPADLWYRSACDCLEGLRADGVDFGRIAAVGVDGISWAGLPVDRDGKPLRPAMTWMDRRAEAEARWMEQTCGRERLFAVSANPPDAAYITPKMLWIRSHEPDVYARTRCFMQCNAFIVMKLTGVFSQDLSQGYGFAFFDMARGRYDEDVAAALGLDPALAAPLVRCHDIVGEVTRTAAGQTGIPAGTPVVAGGLDAACCTLGAGVLDDGQTQEQGGQAGGMSIAVDRPLSHPKLILSFHVVPDRWLLQGGTTGGGGALRWFRNELGHAESDRASETGESAYEIMSREAGDIPPGCGGLLFLPYMAGERSPLWDTQARGAFLGLSYDKTRAHMIRSVMEGVAFALRHNLDTAGETGVRVKELLSVGGSAASAVWTGIKSDVTGLPIRVPDAGQATALGAAMLAGVGCGLYRDFGEAVGETVRFRYGCEPDAARHALYTQLYRQYLELYPVIRRHQVILNELGETKP